MKLLLAEMTRLEARDAFDRGATVVIPTGSTEQHGPHLPLIVDSCTAEHIARSAAARAASDVPIVVAPTVTYGSSHHHLPWAGSMSLSVRTYMAVIEDLIRCVAHHGGKRVALVNGHGGNVAPHDVVTSALTLELDIAVAAVSYWTLAEKELAAEGLDGLGGIPGHAGGFETSLMLALRPDIINLDQRGVGVPAAPADEDWVGPRLGGLVRQLGAFERAGGVSDDAGGASGERGQRLLEVTIEVVRRFLVDFARC